MFRRILILVMVIGFFATSAVGLAADGNLVIEGKAITGKLDVGSGTLEIPNSTNLPTSCVVGEIYMNTDAASGQRCYLCESTNSWILQRDGYRSFDLGEPAFLAIPDANQLNVTGDNTTYNITGAFWDEVFDQDNNFSNGTFTAPTRGYYLLTGVVAISDVGASHTGGSLTVKTSNRDHLTHYHNPYTLQIGGYVSHRFSIIADMDIDDTAYLSLVVNGGTKIIDLYADFTFFQGTLLTKTKEPYLGIWHLQPRGELDFSGDEDCLSGFGYEYEVITYRNDNKTCYNVLHINAGAWVDVDASEVCILSASGCEKSNQLQIKNGTEAFNVRLNKNEPKSDSFAYHYGNETYYPVEFGEICKWKEANDYGRLWMYGADYYLNVYSNRNVASFSRVWEDGGNTLFDIGIGKRSGNYFYCYRGYALDHDGVWNTQTESGSPLKWRFDISNGELREWWSGSESVPDRTTTFTIVDDGTCPAPANDWEVYHCSEFGTDRECEYCKSETPCANLPSR